MFASRTLDDCKPLQLGVCAADIVARDAGCWTKDANPDDDQVLHHSSPHMESELRAYTAHRHRAPAAHRPDFRADAGPHRVPDIGGAGAPRARRRSRRLRPAVPHAETTNGALARGPGPRRPGARARARARAAPCAKPPAKRRGAAVALHPPRPRADTSRR